MEDLAAEQSFAGWNCELLLSPFRIVHVTLVDALYVHLDCVADLQGGFSIEEHRVEPLLVFAKPYIDACDVLRKVVLLVAFLLVRHFLPAVAKLHAERADIGSSISVNVTVDLGRFKLSQLCFT